MMEPTPKIKLKVSDPALAAIRNDDPKDMLKALAGAIHIGGDVNNDPAIVYAARLGAYRCLKKLVVRPEHVNADGNDTGETALHAAASRDDWRVCAMLIAMGAKPVTNREGLYPHQLTEDARTLDALGIGRPRKKRR